MSERKIEEWWWEHHMKIVSEIDVFGQDSLS